MGATGYLEAAIRAAVYVAVAVARDALSFFSLIVSIRPVGCLEMISHFTFYELIGFSCYHHGGTSM